MALGVGIIELSNEAAPALAETGAFLVGILLAIYSVGRYAQGHAEWAGVALIVVAIPGAAIEPGDPTTFSDVAFFVVFFGGPWVVGRFVRHRSERERVLVAEQDVRAREAVAEERTRIARELHDVVAHHVSMIAVQAETARLTTPDLTEEGKERFKAIGDTARDSLIELRRLLGMLREGAPGGAERAPQPGLDDLEALVDAAREAGTTVRLTMIGSPDALPPGVDLTAYRIAQEALTNARRHAPGADVDVELRYEADTLHLEVRDDGQGAISESEGHGIVGMRERAEMIGGRLEAGPREGGGFSVLADLPIKEPA
jgi:signal transduction histidine kinase